MFFEACRLLYLGSWSPRYFLRRWVVRKSVVIFPLWAVLASGCVLFDGPEAEVERKEPALEVGDKTALAPVVAVALPTQGPAPVAVPPSWAVDDIRRMQRRLREVGLDPGPADGIVGARTKSAFNKFQAGCGQVQPLLKTLENVNATGARINQTPSRQETVAMQMQLRQAGFNLGPVDGVYGAKTKAVLAEIKSGCPTANDFAQFLAQPLAAAQSTVVSQVAERAVVVSAPPNNSARLGVESVQPTITPVTGRSQEDIRILQLRLRDAGFDPGPFDGMMGPKTQLALQQLQASQRAGKTKTALTMGLNGQY
jgi:peptidoglycan hydrolase-like protein with peptidoglycan-binding domain